MLFGILKTRGPENCTPVYMPSTAFRASSAFSGFSGSGVDTTTMEFYIFGPLPSWKLDPYGLVGHSLA